LRKRSIVDSLSHFDESDFFLLNELSTFERGGGRAEYYRNFKLSSPPEQQIFRVVMRGWIFLFIGAVVLFVNDDQPEVLKREQRGRAGAEEELDFSCLNFSPVLSALTRRKPRMVKDNWKLSQFGKMV